MNRVVSCALAVLLWGCDTAPTPSPANTPPETDAVAGSAPPAQAELLPTPFTADKIRDEWVEGLTLVMHTRTSGGESWDRWTVVTSDPEGADIEFAPIDAEGNAAGETKTERTAWTALRDHAKYPTDVATREEATRETALGQLDGWLYRVQDQATGSETELFFARQFPGAPIEMRMSKDGVVALEMTQVERQHPAKM